MNIAVSPGKSDASRSMDPLGSRHVRGLVARNRHGVSRLSGASFLEREIAMHRVEELVEASMVLVLHDWDLYRAEKAKR